MNAVYVNPKACTARVEGGATWGDVDRETQSFGLATPSGIISTTGVAGLTLGGGFGWLSRKYGLSADNLLSADIVTADGKLIKASSTEHPDLFWAIRGGGGNFGIITSFEFQLHQVGPEVLFGPTVYRLEDAAEVLRHYRNFTSALPNDCTIYADFLTAPPLPFLPEEIHGTKVLFLIQFYAGEPEKGATALRPLREFGNPVADALAPTQYAEAQSRSDPLYPKGGRYYWKSHNLGALTDQMIDTLVDCADTMPTAQCDILIQQLGGRINDLVPDATAYPHRDAEFVVTLGGRGEQPEQDNKFISWVRECHDALGEHAVTGVYVNFLSHDESRDRLRAAFGNNTERLQSIKARYDPNNFFHINQNIVPSSAA
jgi:FAD/FMN-containing dehydrogenase